MVSIGGEVWSRCGRTMTNANKTMPAVERLLTGNGVRSGAGECGWGLRLLLLLRCEMLALCAVLGILGDLLVLCPPWSKL